VTEIPYQLSIAPSLEAFRPEIEHACGFIEACYEIRRTPDADLTLHYGPDAPAGCVAIPAILFPQAVRIDSSGIWPQQNILRRIAADPKGNLRPPQQPSNAGTSLSYDALGLIFLLISRLEERGYTPLDRYDRFPVSAALFQPEGGRLYPFADRAARDIVTALTGNTNPVSRSSYAVHFSHDVDILRGYHRPLEPLRYAAGDLLKRAQPARAITRLRNAYLYNEPRSSFRRLMDLSERHGLVSRFYFMGPSDDRMDSPYVLRMPGLLRRMADEIRQRGHEIGFHPGFHTATDQQEWRRQRDGLEAVIGTKLREGRHHVLRYDAVVTPKIWSDAGMEFDCTPAYPEAVGFRTGSCRPHKAYDLVARSTLPLTQLSTAVMEFGLLGGKYRDLPVEEAVAEASWAIDMCREYGGTLALLFHSGQNDKQLWRWLEDVVEQASA
jgi:hypothetical protein